MKTQDPVLDRLLAAARRAPPPPAGDLPPGLATRVLARLRPAPESGVWWEGLAAKLALTGCAAAAVVALTPGPDAQAADEVSRIADALIHAELQP